MGIQILRRVGQPYWKAFFEGLVRRSLTTTLSDQEQARERRLQVQASMMSIQAGAALGLVTGLCVTLLMAFWDGAAGQPFLWMTFLGAGLLHALWLVARYREMPTDEAGSDRLIRLLILNGAYCGLVWGSAAWFMLPAATLEGETFLIIALAMVFIGGGASSTYRPVDLAFVLPGISMFALGLLRLGSPYQTLLAAAFMMLALLILRFSKTQHDNTIAMIRLSLEAQRLLSERTEQRELAESLRQQAEQAMEQAKVANQGKTAFLAAAGHDLRQPMHALVQYHAHLGRHSKDPALNGTIARIGKSLDAMQDLLDSMLEVSKLLTGSVEPVVSRVSSLSLIDELDAQLRPVAENKGLELVAMVDDCLIETDEVLLGRIMRNLTLNAIRYTRSGRVTLRGKRCGAWLRLQVWDTGIGIHSSEREKIFQEFYQIDNDARDARKGLGLGLSLVRQLTSLLGLRLRMRSTFGRGSVFMVDVPIAAANEKSSPTSINGAVPDMVRGSFLVLIDDNQASLESTADTLRDFGARVLTCRSGLEALDRLQGQELLPQLVISDYRLEHGETGLNAIKMVIENQKALFGDEFEIAALVISGDTAPRELLAVQASGYAMLHKPLRPEVLYEAVNARLIAQVNAVV